MYKSAALYILQLENIKRVIMKENDSRNHKKRKEIWSITKTIDSRGNMALSYLHLLPVVTKYLKWSYFNVLLKQIESLMRGQSFRKLIFRSQNYVKGMPQRTIYHIQDTCMTSGILFLKLSFSLKYLNQYSI